jgi:hypothetical protein
MERRRIQVEGLRLAAGCKQQETDNQENSLEKRYRQLKGFKQELWSVKLIQ